MNNPVSFLSKLQSVGHLLGIDAVCSVPRDGAGAEAISEDT